MKPETFNKAMGAVVRRLRLQHGLTQSDVGKALGVSYQQVQKSETGSNGFGAHYLPKLAELFGLTVADLYEQAGVKAMAKEPTPAENDGFLAARYVARISNARVRRYIVDSARKLAYTGDLA